jgi:hypothetical protein
MSDPESFLLRWSRRKRAAARESDAASSRRARPDDGDIPETGGLEPAAPPFDPAALPPIDSITAETNIRAFLAPGAPPALTRAALRRVWTADPKIRNFVGLADYAWDFNAPGSMAGFGPLEAAEALRREVARPIPGTTADGDGAMSDPRSAEATPSPDPSIPEDARPEAGGQTDREPTATS